MKNKEKKIKKRLPLYVETFKKNIQDFIVTLNDYFITLYKQTEEEYDLIIKEAVIRYIHNFPLIQIIGDFCCHDDIRKEVQIDEIPRYHCIDICSLDGRLVAEISTVGQMFDNEDGAYIVYRNYKDINNNIDITPKFFLERISRRWKMKDAIYETYKTSEIYDMSYENKDYTLYTYEKI